MPDTGKSRSRRAEIRKHRPDRAWLDWHGLRASGALASLAIAAAFFVVAWGILTLRQEVVPYRPGQWIPHDIVSRVDFSYPDKDLLAQMRHQRRESEPRVYRAQADAWSQLRRDLLTLPDRVTDPDAKALGQLPKPLGSVLDSGAVTALRQYATDKGAREVYEQKVNAYVDGLRNQQVPWGGQKWGLFVLTADKRAEDLSAGRPVAIQGRGVVPVEVTFAADSREFRDLLTTLAQRNVMLSTQQKIVELTVALMKPTHAYDDNATKEA